MKKRIILAVLFAGFFSVCFGSALSTLANTMKAGEWAVLNNNGDSSGFGEQLLKAGGCIGDILGYSNNGQWDPIARKFHFMGSPHCGGAAGNGYVKIQYDEAANQWTYCLASNSSCMGSYITDNNHAYDHAAIDPATQIWYRRNGQNRVSKYSFATNGPWSDLSNASVGYGIHGALAWFPELDGAGGLVLIQGGYGEIHLWNKNTNLWRTGIFQTPMGNYHNVAEYNPVHHVVVGGGGNGDTNLYKVNPAGTVTKMKAAPPNLLGVTSGVLTVDPVSGDYLLLGNGNLFYTYDVLTDTWTLQGGQTPKIFPVSSNGFTSIIGTAISTYGVIMFVKYDASNSKVTLYKHKNVPANTSLQVSGKTLLASFRASPNPFRGTTRILVPAAIEREISSMDIYDLRGKKIVTLAPQVSGDFSWEAGNLSAGVYIAHFAAQGKTYEHRLILMK